MNQRMNDCVPEFEMGVDYSIATSSVPSRPRKSAMVEEDDDVMELLWQNGQVVLQSQNQRSLKNPTEIHSSHNQNQHLFMQEDEMASWLHYPLNDSDFCADLLYPSAMNVVARELTVVDSSVTPALATESRVSEARRSTEGERDLGTCETVTSSPGGSSASAEPAFVDDRKRKEREADEECHSEDVELESVDAKKQTRGSTSIKRSRAAEVHNLSERRRRDRINEKMKALQELIPRCNKSDKASMLDEAIEYLKSLQLQVQMMSMGCGMVPMMFPGIQQFIPNMGMGMGMEMGMNRPIMPFPNIIAGSILPTPTAAAHLGPRFPMPAYMQHVPAPDPSRVQANNQPDPMLNSFGMQNPNQPRVSNFVNPYQQYLGLQQMQLPVVQNQSMAQASSSKPSTSKGPENPENHSSGRG
ncbi:hypothetical protein Ddye_016329 [Dipteronia dyeriana]|uniref:BHLH domain-containing protein n=1 Tax=Dipteronia dyeriana TaxID=168575 RepID=A0AAD9X0D2_9ROSI|nr:hypothetical protein Ddye_016329 [Dipteronia dyeriana]